MLIHHVRITWACRALIRNIDLPLRQGIAKNKSINDTPKFFDFVNRYRAILRLNKAFYYYASTIHASWQVHWKRLN